jgi:Hint domain
MTAKLQGLVAGIDPVTVQTNKGIAQGTVVLTAQGAMPVEYLSPGDKIITRDGLRVLADIAVQVFSGDAVCVGASTLGHDRPQTDVIMGTDQAILIRDWRAKALYGTAQAMVPAARLADGELIRRTTVSGLRLYRLEFAQPAVIYAGGLELVCDAVSVAA